MAFPLNSNLKPRGPLAQLSFDDWNTLANMANGLRIMMTAPDMPPQVLAPDQQGHGWTLVIPSGGEGTGGGLDLRLLDFGCEIEDSHARRMRLNGGEFRFGAQRWTVGPMASAVITTTPAYVYLEYERGYNPSIAPPTADLNATVSDANAYRHLLYTFEIDGAGALKIKRIHHLGAVVVAAYWA